MDGVAIALQAPEEAESEDANGEADEGHYNPNTSDDSQKQLMHSVINLEEIIEKWQITKDVSKAKEALKNNFFRSALWRKMKHFMFLMIYEEEDT